MPATFWFPGDVVQFWTPMALTMTADGRLRRTSMMARLADGVSIDAAVAELQAIGTCVANKRRSTPTASS